MTSKKYRKKLKEQYDRKQPRMPSKVFLQDREEILNYLKTKQYELVSSTEIIANTNLNFPSQGSVSNTIKAINYYTDEYIEAKRGKGYIYYG